MMNTRLIPLLVLLSACSTTLPATHPVHASVDDTDTIGEVVAKFNRPVQAASKHSDQQIEQQLSHLVLENVRLREEIQRLKEKFTPQASPISPKVPPKKKLIKASHSIKPTTQPMVHIIDPDAPEVPTLAQITPTTPKNDEYALAQQQFQKKNYQRVIHMLRGADAGGDGSVVARKQMYLLLLSHQKLDNCQSVISIGQRLAGHFTGSNEAAEAQFMVGQCQWNIQQRDIAKDTWRKLIASQPHSAAAQRAKFSITQY